MNTTVHVPRQSKRLGTKAGPVEVVLSLDLSPANERGIGCSGQQWNDISAKTPTQRARNDTYKYFRLPSPSNSPGGSTPRSLSLRDLEILTDERTGNANEADRHRAVTQRRGSLCGIVVPSSLTYKTDSHIYFDG